MGLHSVACCPVVVQESLEAILSASWVKTSLVFPGIWPRRQARVEGQRRDIEGDESGLCPAEDTSYCERRESA